MRCSVRRRGHRPRSVQGRSRFAAAEHFEIADVSKMWVVLQRPRAGHRQVGLGPEVTSPAATPPWPATISWMSTSVDEKTRTVEVRAKSTIRETGRRRRQAHRQAAVASQLVWRRHDPRARKSRRRWCVPTKAVQRVRTQPMVFVQGDEQTLSHRRELHLGVVTSEYTEIIAGLSPEERSSSKAATFSRPRCSAPRPAGLLSRWVGRHAAATAPSCQAPNPADPTVAPGGPSSEPSTDPHRPFHR